MLPNRWGTWLGRCAWAVALSGCRILDRGESDGAGGSDELSVAEQGLVDDSNDVELNVQGGARLAALPTFAFIGRRESLTLARAVQLQALAPATFLPAGCATVETVGNVVTYTFEGCSGPLGLEGLSGRETVTFRPGAEVGSVEMTMRSDGLTLQGRAVTHDATAVFTLTDEGRELTYEGEFSGTTALGRPVSHEASLRVAIDAEAKCATLDGASRGAVGLRAVDTTFDGLRRCAPSGTCPSGVITSTGRLGYALRFDFDGSDTAVVTTPRGRTIDVDLACTPLEIEP